MAQGIAGEALVVAVDDATRVSALLDVPAAPRAVLVLGHGAGAGMAHPFMAATAKGLAVRGIACLRYQFPSMEAGSRRPDRPPVAHATVRAAVAEARRRFAELSLFAGGKSFGGRMTSQAQALEPLPGVAGLVFLGFPLHAAGAPSSDRARHLFDVHTPMLFVQGTRDKLAEFGRIEKLVAELEPLATLMRIDEADHSFHVLVRSGRNDREVMAQILDASAGWMLR